MSDYDYLRNLAIIERKVAYHVERLEKREVTFMSRNEYVTYLNYLGYAESALRFMGRTSYPYDFGKLRITPLLVGEAAPLPLDSSVTVESLLAKSESTDPA